MIPVKGAGFGEVCVLCAGVGGVANECVYPCFVRVEPAGVKVADYSGGVDEVGPMEALVWGLGLECNFSFFPFCSIYASLRFKKGEKKRGWGSCLLVVVIVRVTKIRSGVASRKCSSRDYSSPLGIVD